MIVSGTGHRKIFDRYYPHRSWNKVCEETTRILEELKPTLIWSGGAMGFDSLIIDAAMAIGIAYSMAIPFKGQESRWNLESQERYQSYIKGAESVVIVSDGGYSVDKMQARNEYLVNNCDTLIALFNPRQGGGTMNCLNYAKKVGKPIIQINPLELR